MAFGNYESLNRVIERTSQELTRQMYKSPEQYKKSKQGTIVPVQGGNNSWFAQLPNKTRYFSKRALPAGNSF